MSTATSLSKDTPTKNVSPRVYVSPPDGGGPMKVRTTFGA